MGDLLHVVGAAILERGRCLVTQRGEEMANALEWEFPGGKVEAGEDPRRALAREIREELGLVIAVGDHLGRGTHHTGERRIVLDVFAARVTAGTVRLAEHHRYGWFDATTIRQLDWSVADRPVLPHLFRLLDQNT